MPVKGGTMSPEQREKIRAANLTRYAARTHKTCPRCSVSFPIEVFTPSRPGRRLESYCRPCRCDRETEWRRRQDRSKRQAIQRRQDLRIKFGLTPEQYDQMLADQDGRCAICQRDTPGARRRYFAVDHDHDTGAIRGLLCMPCNSGIGHLGDDAERLRAGAAYLEQHVTHRRSA